jgi:uncharacterized membrane protein HdeD (DUF308 family)
MSSIIVGSRPQELRRLQGWMLAIGIVLAVLGAAAIADSVVASIVSVVSFGWLLVIVGIIGIIHTLRHRKNGHFALHLLDTIFALVVGVMLLLNSLAGMLVLTLLMAIYFIVTGVYRIGFALTTHGAGSGWTLLSGVITLLLGILVWMHWPTAALWIIGLFIGVNLLITGLSQIMLALALRRAAVEAV